MEKSSKKKQKSLDIYSQNQVADNPKNKNN